jgi:Cu(I)/Ag(I) efflux system membrane fusion protein
MSEGHTVHSPQSDGVPSAPPPAPRHGFWWKTWLVFKVVQARLRFFLLLGVVGVVIASWGTLAAYYEKWTRPLYGEAQAADPDTEYFCPMHPYIVRDNAKEKCPICHMDLARRKKGSDTAAPLAPGTVSRVQLTPYRVVLSGALTDEVRARPLSKTITAFGTVEFNEARQAHIAARQKARVVRLSVNFTGQAVEVGDPLAVLDVHYSPELSVTLEDLQRALQGGDKEAERMARQRLRLWDIDSDQLEPAVAVEALRKAVKAGDKAGEKAARKRLDELKADPKQVEESLGAGKTYPLVTLTSPIDGEVTRKYPREGAFVDEGAPLYDIDNIETVWIEAQVYEADIGLLAKGLPVRATTEAFPGEVFSGTLDFVYPHLDEASRTLTVRFGFPNNGHKLRPGMYATVTIDARPDRVGPLVRAAAEDGAAVAAAESVARGPGLTALLYAAGRQAELEQGLLPSVPDSAVIDTGSLKVVYRQAAPDIFEGVAVALGPRMTAPGSGSGNAVAYYPVLRGLAAGDRVVVNGAFLIDAETRLNPAAGSIYYGGSGGKAGGSSVAVRPSTPMDEDAVEKKVRTELAKLSDADRRQAQEQKYCVVRRNSRLGGDMGAPVKVTFDDGTSVFVCCESCVDKARKDPQASLRAAEELKKANARPPAAAPPPPPSLSPSDEKDVQDNLAKLSDDDRKLAEAQKWCPVQTDSRLGAMGVPVKIMIKDQPVFLCCKLCKKDAQADAERTLRKVQELKARAKVEGHAHE